MTKRAIFHTLDDFLEGQVFVIDKPLEWTSFDVVNKVRGTIRHTFDIRKIKVGHAGTLDPLASGVLIICTGRKTKTIDLIQAGEKTYTGTIRLGVTTPSFDAETGVDNWGEGTHIDKLDLQTISHAATQNLIGNLAQMPPQFSAKKVDGVTAYKAARKGKTVALQPKAVTVVSFDIHSFTQEKIKGANDKSHPVVDVGFEIVCSKGTYIRALARDLGEILKVGGTLTSLRRTKSGNFDVENAWDLTELLETVKSCAPATKNE
jgi:tRNA pseudouridine55 synthase